MRTHGYEWRYLKSMNQYCILHYESVVISWFVPERTTRINESFIKKIMVQIQFILAAIVLELL